MAVCKNCFCVQKIEARPVEGLFATEHNHAASGNKQATVSPDLHICSELRALVSNQSAQGVMVLRQSWTHEDWPSANTTTASWVHLRSVMRKVILIKEGI